VMEVAQNECYQVSDTKYYVEFEYAGQDVSIVHISVNNGEKIENQLIRGNIIGKKVNEEGDVIEGAVFGLFKADELNFSEETAILLATSDKDGLFEFSDVPYGTWIIRELKTLPEYILDETSYKVSVHTHEEIIEMTFVNKLAPIPESPQTGDHQFASIWIGLLAIAIGGIVSIGIIYIRKGRRK